MPHQLDDRSFVTRLDPKEMLRLTEEFGQQCRRAYEIAQEIEFPPFEARPSVVVLSGLGGSAAGGDFAQRLVEEHGAAPFFVNRDYHIPKFVGLKDVVFCASYSGNTEETLTAYDEAKHAGARIIAITSGGKLADMAEADGYPVIRIPGGQPPRTALGFMMIPVIVALQKLQLIPEPNYEAAFALLDECAKRWSVDAPFEQNEAKKLAQELQGKVSVLYGLGPWQYSVANRWKGQINENAKNMCFANQYPELNHNEILGWVKANEQGVQNWVGVLLQDGTESAKMKKRAEVSERLVKDVAPFHAVTAQGDTLLEKMLSLVYMGDFVSLYLAALNGVDPENIDSINVLKNELSQVQ